MRMTVAIWRDVGGNGGGSVHPNVNRKGTRPEKRAMEGAHHFVIYDRSAPQILVLLDIRSMAVFYPSILFTL